MHYVYWIVTLPLLIVFATFAAANRQNVTLDFWPFEYQLTLPVALVLLGSLLTGLVIGAFVMWLRAGAARARARRAEQRANSLEREVAELKRSAASTPRPAAGAGGLKTISGPAGYPPVTSGQVTSGQVTSSHASSGRR